MEKEAVAAIAAMFGWNASSAISPPAARWRTSRRSGWPGSCARARRSWPRRRRTTRTQRISRRAGTAVRKSIPATVAAAWTCDALESDCREGDVGTRGRDAGHDRDRRGRPAARDPANSQSTTASASTSTRHTAATSGLRRILGGRSPRGFRPDRAGRFDRDRSAQARAPALRLRLRAVPRSGGGPLLQARLAVYVLHLVTSCTSARSAWSVRGRARPPSPCGPRRGCCRSCPAENSRAAWRAAGRRLLNSTADSAGRPFRASGRRRSRIGHRGLEAGRRHAAPGIGTRPENL